MLRFGQLVLALPLALSAILLATAGPARAEQLARLAGVNLGRPRLIEESDASGGPIVRATGMAAPAAEGTPIAGGQLEVRTTVRVVWDIG